MQVFFKYYTQEWEVAIQRRSIYLKFLKIICEEVNS